MEWRLNGSIAATVQTTNPRSMSIRKFMVAIWGKDCSRRKLTAMTRGEVAARGAMQQPEMET
jgi:hypothetical protein